MKWHFNRLTHTYGSPLLLAIALLGGLLFMSAGYLLWKVNRLGKELTEVRTLLDSTASALAEVSDSFASDLSLLRTETTALSENLSNTKEDVARTTSTLDTVQSKVGGVEQVVGSISGTVSTLEKLAKVDPELLQKYSKVYFLNENFSPARVAEVDQQFVYSNSEKEYFMAEALPYLHLMLAAAKAQSIELYVKSGYRSFSEQQAVKSQYVVTYGAGTANAFSADQGYSEHQLGTTIDLITPGLGGRLVQAFDQTSAYHWLKENAHKFGFILSYPKGNEFYIYEPWHWRFVGVELATYLQSRNLNFYDVDQRTIDPYLAKFFD